MRCYWLKISGKTLQYQRPVWKGYAGCVIVNNVDGVVITTLLLFIVYNRYTRSAKALLLAENYSSKKY